jgi:hypothetical protein
MKSLPPDGDASFDWENYYDHAAVSSLHNFTLHSIPKLSLLQGCQILSGYNIPKYLMTTEVPNGHKISKIE